MQKRKKSLKALLIVAAIATLILIAAVGTIAWLSDTSEQVVNTFLPTDIDIELKETASSFTDNDNNANTNSYQLIPGHTITKDPKVTVKANSEKCFVFVELTEANWPDLKVKNAQGADTAVRKVDYAIADGWTKLELSNLAAGKAVYYRVVEESTTEQDQEFYVIKENQVTVDSSLTKDEMETIAKNTNGNPKLTVQAYACQYYKSNTATDGDATGTAFTAAEAWAVCKPASN